MSLLRTLRGCTIESSTVTGRLGRVVCSGMMHLPIMSAATPPICIHGSLRRDHLSPHTGSRLAGRTRHPQPLCPVAHAWLKDRRHGPQDASSSVIGTTGVTLYGHAYHDVDDRFLTAIRLLVPLPAGRDGVRVRDVPVVRWAGRGWDRDRRTTKRRRNVIAPG